MPDLIEALAQPFMQRAIAAAICCGVACACIGTHLVARRMTFVGSALTHTLLPGVAAAWLMGYSPYAGGLAAALVTAVLIATASGRKGGGEDAAIGVVQSGLFALGIVLLAAASSWRDLTGLLFGSVLGVDSNELTWVAALSAATLLLLLVAHRGLEATAVDEDYARQRGLRPALLRLGLVVLAGVAATAAVRLIGAMLTSALLIVPAATGILLGRSLAGAMAWAAAVAIAGSIAGLLASYHLAQLPAGAAMALSCCLAFAAARTWRAIRG